MKKIVCFVGLFAVSLTQSLPAFSDMSLISDILNSRSESEINLDDPRYSINEMKFSFKRITLYSPLGVAIEKNYSLRFIQKLLDRGAQSSYAAQIPVTVVDIGIPVRVRTPAIAYAIFQKRLDVAKLLFAKFGLAALDRTFIPVHSSQLVAEKQELPTELSPMHLAVGSGQLDFVEWLVSVKADPNFLGQKHFSNGNVKYTPRELACYLAWNYEDKESEKIYQVLQAQGAKSSRKVGTAVRLYLDFVGAGQSANSSPEGLRVSGKPDSASSSQASSQDGHFIDNAAPDSDSANTAIELEILNETTLRLGSVSQPGSAFHTR